MKISRFLYKMCLVLASMVLIAIIIPTNVLADDCGNTPTDDYSQDGITLKEYHYSDGVGYYNIIQNEEQILLPAPCQEVYSGPSDAEDNFLTIINRTTDNVDGEFKFRIKAYNDNFIIMFKNFERVSDNDFIYEFILKNNEAIRFVDFPYNYTYEIEELTLSGWELVSVNDEKGISRLNGKLRSAGSTNEYVFLNTKLLEDVGDNNIETNTNAESSSEPGISVPNTGKNTGRASAVRTGIVAFAIAVTVGRVIYLIRKYKR